MQAVTRLTLSDFRCYSFLRIEVEPGPVVLTGPNGAGKTNILEALSFLAPGRGLRGAQLSEVTRRDAEAGASWGVAAVVERSGIEGGTVEIGTGREAGSERRAVHIDRRPVRGQAALSEVASLLWLTPAMDRLFIEGSTGRRRFLDRLVLGLDPAHAARAAAYDRALRERARLLREGRFDPAWLDALEETMAGRGVAMAAARKQAVVQLSEACAEGIGPFPAASLAVTGSVEDDLDRQAPEAAEIRLRNELAASRRREAETGRTADGPHRSQLVVRHLGRDLPAEQCSTGEQKAVLVAIVLAQARIQARSRGAGPILLLDEIAAHLDSERRAALFDELVSLGGQSWMTGTDQSLFAELAGRATFFCVRDASVSRTPS